MTISVGLDLSHECRLSACLSAAEEMIGIYGIFDSHHECNICQKSCLEMASVGIETLLKAILERTDRRTISRNRSGHSLAEKVEIALFYATP